MNSFDLYFTSSPDLQLVKTCFYFNFNAPIITVRGKNFTHSGQSGSFLWSSGVKSLAYFLIQSVCLSQMGSKNVFILSGAKKSLAHSLSLTIIKEPNWLAEMFGVDVQGNTRARKLLQIRNQYYNLGNLVEISLNTQFLALTEINFYLNDQKQTSIKSLIQLRESLDIALQDSKRQNEQAQVTQLGFDFL